MKVSIITICYNSAATIEDTIQSVLAQKHPDIDYIIVDGGSTDDTMHIVARYKERIATIISEKDNGIYDAMNKGIAQAQGTLVGILNSDDFYADDQVITDVIQQLGAADAIYADLVYVDKDDPEKVTRRWESGHYKPGAFLKGWMPPHPTFFVKKALYDTLGVYNTTLNTSADYELMLRFLHKHEVPVAYLPRVITKMRVGGQSNVSFSNRIKANKEDRLAWKMNGLKPGALTFIRKPLSKLGQFFKK